METKKQIVKKAVVTVVGRNYKKDGIMQVDYFDEPITQTFYVPTHIKNDDVATWIIKQFKLEICLQEISEE